MPPTIALLVWLVLLLGLLFFNSAKRSGTSIALWVPLIWMFFIASRLPSQWLGGQVGNAAQALEEGNPLDRTIFLVLIMVASVVLMSRSFKWGYFFAHNRFLIAFIIFGLLSVAWSDFPFVAFKRWFRDLGNYLMVLVVLSDPSQEAVRTFLRRLFYLVIPLSVLLIRYYPQIGRHYSFWTGIPEYVGAATSKNTLGFLCMMSGIFFTWDTVTRWSDGKSWRARQLPVNVAFMAMTFWLLNVSDSATSRICLIIGCLIVVTARCRWSQRHPAFLKTLIPACFLLYLIVAFGFGLNGVLASKIGRDSTFTGRTVIWQAVLSTNTNPMVGTGYQSFWLGPRLNQVWRLAGPVNEAHNGYLEVYLDLGAVGLLLLCGLLISSYRAIYRNPEPFSTQGSLSLALWTITLFYNMTEAAFTAAFMCLTFLLVTVAVSSTAAVPDVPSEEPKFQSAILRGRRPLIPNSSGARHF
jgi:exopolysaccharide production protein ExoQ